MTDEERARDAEIGKVVQATVDLVKRLRESGPVWLDVDEKRVALQCIEHAVQLSESYLRAVTVARGATEAIARSGLLADVDGAGKWFLRPTTAADRQETEH